MTDGKGAAWEGRLSALVERGFSARLFAGWRGGSGIEGVKVLVQMFAEVAELPSEVVLHSGEEVGEFVGLCAQPVDKMGESGVVVQGEPFVLVVARWVFAALALCPSEQAPLAGE